MKSIKKQCYRTLLKKLCYEEEIYSIIQLCFEDESE